MAITELGWLLYFSRQYDRAIKQFQQTLELDPSSLSAHLGFRRLKNNSAQRPMTPNYASPEQVRGQKITTASDVYTLGVLLYELLTGHRPCRLRTEQRKEIERVICDQESERPSTVINRTEKRPAGDGATLAHLDTAETLVGLGLLLTEHERARDAEALLREALSTDQKVLPQDNWQSANAQSALGECLTAMKRFDEAEAMLTGSYATLKAWRGEKDMYRRRAAARLLNL